MFKEGQFRHSLELSLVKLPQDVLLEYEQVRAPIFTYDAYYGLPKDFQAELRFTTVIFFTNHIALGAKWAHDWGRLHASVGDDMAYMWGHLDNGAVKTFDNSIKGWFNYPNISVGYAFDNFALSMKAELNIITTLTTFSDGIKLSTDANIFNGGAVGVYLEQPLWKDHFINLGFKANYITFYYPSWPMFPVYTKHYFIPEFILGFHL